jgi:hypothetical protein
MATVSDIENNAKTDAPGNRTAFLTAPARMDTSTIRSALEEHGIHPMTLDEAVRPGEDIAESLEACLQKADFVLAVLGKGQEGGNVLFELGYARALNKRILVLVPSDSPIPFGALGVPYLRTTPENLSQATEFGITQLLLAPHHGERRKNRGPRTRPIGDAADQLLARLKSSAGNERMLSDIVLEAIRLSGASAESQIGTRQVQADIAVWLEDLAPWIGNPLLIELRSRIVTQRDIESVVHTMSHAVGSTPGGWGLVVYLEGNPVLWKRGGFPLLFISAEDLLKQIKDRSFSDIVWGLRNLKVHGME